MKTHCRGASLHRIYYVLYSYGTVFSYSVLIVITSIFHEPWRDEAQAWLLSRDLSIIGLLNDVAYDGHPILWHLIIHPFARFGFPYETMFVIHILIAITIVILIVRFSPLPRPINVLFVFSYLIAFEYAIIARNYSISLLLLVLIAISYPQRHHHPYRFALLGILLINTNVFISFVGVALALLFLYEAFRQRKINRHIVAGFCAMIFSTMLLIGLLSLHPDRMEFGLVSSYFEPEMVFIAANRMLFHGIIFSPLSAALYLVVFLLLVALAFYTRWLD